jgi:hypothetical protein
VHWVDDPELGNEWCNYGVATSAMIREHLRRGTIHFETEAGTFASLSVTGPAEIVRQIRMGSDPYLIGCRSDRGQTPS